MKAPFTARAVVFGLLRGFLLCGLGLVATCGSGDASVWRCADIVGSAGPVICTCDLRPLAEQDIDHSALQCSQSTDCCLLWKDKTRCTCDQHVDSAECDRSARSQEATVVGICPPLH